MTGETASLSLLRSEVNADRYFSVYEFVSFHLGIEFPLFEGLDAGEVDSAILCGHQHHERGLSRFADENAGLDGFVFTWLRHDLLSVRLCG